RFVAERAQVECADDTVRGREWNGARGTNTAREDERALRKAAKVRSREDSRHARLEHVTGRRAVERALGRYGHIRHGPEVVGRVADMVAQHTCLRIEEAQRSHVRAAA